MDTLPIERKITTERKTFTATLGSNDRGKFLRITEAGSSRYSTSIVVPMAGVAPLMDAIAQVMNEAHQKRV